MKIKPSVPRSSLLAAALVVAGLIATSAHAAANGNPTKGETLFKAKCSICHETAAGKNKVGPSLHNVAGHKAGTADGFKLYRGLKDANWTWDDATLNAYLADPPAYTKDKNNNKTATMVLKTINPQDRDDIVAFLKTLH